MHSWVVGLITVGLLVIGVLGLITFAALSLGAKIEQWHLEREERARIIEREQGEWRRWSA